MRSGTARLVPAWRESLDSLGDLVRLLVLPHSLADSKGNDNSMSGRGVVPVSWYTFKVQCLALSCQAYVNTIRDIVLLPRLALIRTSNGLALRGTLETGNPCQSSIDLECDLA